MDKERLNRRDFIKITSTAALALSGGLLKAETENSFDAKGIPTRKLGRTGFGVPLIGIGCGSRFLSIDDLDASDTILNYTLDHGMYYWDTAANYEWNGKISEERLGRVLKYRRKEVWLSTKVNERDGDKANRQIERSLKRLGTDYLDELKIHSVESLEDVDKILKKGNVYDVISRWKREGVVKNIGFSGHSSAKAMASLAKMGEFDTMLIAMNHFAEGDENFENDAIPVASNKNMGIITMKVIRPRETVNTIPANDLIRYALSVKKVDCAILGIDSLEILKKNIAIAKAFQPLDQKRMRELQSSLKPFFQHKNVAWMQPGYQDGNWV